MMTNEFYSSVRYEIPTEGTCGICQKEKTLTHCVKEDGYHDFAMCSECTKMHRHGERELKRQEEAE